MSTLLIVNADDLGLAHCVNRGIEKAHREGILTSASLMANCPAFEDGVRIAKENPRLGIGVHLNLVRGHPLSSPDRIYLLLDRQGMLFWPQNWRFFLAPPPPILAQAEIEYRAQIERVLATGIAPTHLDSEKHHACSPAMDRLLLRLAQEYGIAGVRNLRESIGGVMRFLPWPGWRAFGRALLLRAITAYGEARRAREHSSWEGKKEKTSRPRRPRYFFGQAHIGQMTEEVWVRLLTHLPEGSVEVMTHPGEWDEGELRELEPQIRRSWLERMRPLELAALLSPRVQQALQVSSLRLGTFADL